LVELHELDAIAKERALSEIEGPLVEGGSQEYKFFQCVANSNKRNNTVDSLVVNDCLFKFYKNK
jgi:hypothetical protein